MYDTAIQWTIALVLLVTGQQIDSGSRKISGLEKSKTADVPADDSVMKLSRRLEEPLQRELASFPEFSDEDKGAVDNYSRRGDLHMFLGHFAEAEADYQKMVTLNPESDASHWRLGIAKYFAGHPEQAAAQFDRYHSFDNVDRENGIWRYLSHHSAFGKERAREQLLKYEKDDRPPFREVYQLFDGTMSPEEVLKSISPDLPEASRQSRLFYAHLYIGMNHVAEGQKLEALKSLREATLNGWPEKAGFGPNYMWHVGRLQYLKIHQK
jgi:lipoprotein NlpI